MRKKEFIFLLVKFGVFLLIAYVLWNEFSGLNFSTVVAHVQQIGIASPLIFLPVLMMSLADSQAWAACFITGRRGFTFPEAFTFRVATDALHNSLPAGVAVAETVRPMVAKRLLGVPYPDGIAAGIISKLNTAVTNLVFLIIGIVILAFFIGGNEPAGTALGSPGLYVIGIIVVMAIGGLLWLPYRGTTFTALRNFLLKIPVKQVHAYIEKHGASLLTLDAYIQTFTREHKSNLYKSIFLYLIGWFVTAFETYIIVTLLGQEITLLQAIAIESSISFVRIVFFFLPAAVGAQEVGFLTLFTALGIAEPVTTSAAFIFLRRSKEIVWIALGFGFFSTLKLNPFKPVLAQT